MSCCTVEESSLSNETAKNNNNTNLCQEDSERSADVLFNDNVDIIMAEEVIEVILDQIIGDVIHTDQVQDTLQNQNQDYLCVNNDEQVSDSNLKVLFPKVNMMHIDSK